MARGPGLLHPRWVLPHMESDMFWKHILASDWPSEAEPDSWYFES